MLLAGQADEQIAIQAFNNGLIDQFVPKQTTDITRHLLGVLRKLSQTPHPRLNTLWRAALRPAQQSMLQIPSVAQALRAYRNALTDALFEFVARRLHDTHVFLTQDGKAISQRK